MTPLLRLLVMVCVFMPPAVSYADRVRLTADPSGATVTIVGPYDSPQLKRGETRWITPVEVDIARNRSEQPYVVEISKDGYQTETTTLDVRKKQLSLHVTLAPLRIEKQVRITSTPAGAQVYAGEQLLGVTPLSARLTFVRTDKKSPWSTFALRATVADHQEESSTLTLDDADAPVSFELARLVDTRRLKVTARTLQGQAIDKAFVDVDGAKVAETPAEISLTFKRSDKRAPWPTFALAVHIPDEYKRVERTITLDRVGDIAFDLTPVTEMNVIRYFPTVEMTPRGPRLMVDTTPTIGAAIDERDEGTAAEGTVRITNFERGGPTLQALNSFAVTPDGQSLVYAVTYRGEGNRYYSNLHLRGTNPSNSTTVQLTRGPRFIDAYPSLCREADSRLVVFQSNRGRIETCDISSFRISDGRLVGGIQQLTRESRFNYQPTLVSEAQPIFFTSLEEFPQADPRVSSVRSDGSAYTNHGESGEMLNYAENGRIYFARLAPDTGRYQLFSILADGTGAETFLSDSEFANANCHSPKISPDGQRLLFVSDYNPDKSARKDNNIWLLDLSGNRQPVQLTNNLSDDILPVWSPTEPDVVYFMSNRRGVYNVWKLTFRIVH